ncbi:DUF3467 domain-containing protein [bacterium]|nr:DUF3467 domain-containing protein [bacterium]
MPEQEEGQAAQPEQEEQQGTVLHVRDQDVKTAYANICLLSGTKEETILSFGMSFPQMNQETKRVEANMLVSNRIIMNPTAAKRLAIALSQSIQQYESRFGVIQLEQPPAAQTPPAQS